MMLEEHQNFICIKLDFRNAFNEIFRARVIEALEETSSLKHLAAHAASLLAPGSGLESRGTLWGESWEGTTQGDPESGPYFAIAIQKFVVLVNAKLAEGGGCAKFGWDDGYLLGPPQLAIEALELFSNLAWFCKEAKQKYSAGMAYYQKIFLHGWLELGTWYLGDGSQE